MPAQVRPFIVYQGGVLPTTIIPRGWKGWGQFAAWLALLTPLLVWLANLLQTQQSGTDFATGLFLFMMGVIGWLVAGLWWMLAHGEVIRVTVIKRDKLYARRKLAREHEHEREREREQGQNA
jgi:Zn-dependent protease with chaperone function